MSSSNDLTNLAIKANAIYNSVSANTSGLISLTIGNTVINSSSITISSIITANLDYGLITDTSSASIDYGTVP
jgi:hypothetical protein